MKALFSYAPLLIAATLTGAAVENEAQAFRKFLNQFSEHYDANGIATDTLTDETSCGLCHVRAGGGGRRTPYGEDFLSTALDEGKGFPGIEFFDSDSDGFNNLEEIFLRVHPGKADSTPSTRIDLSLSSQDTLKVIPNGACTQLTLKAFGFTFTNGQSDFTQSNVATPIEISVSGSRGAILAKCEAEQSSGSLLAE